MTNRGNKVTALLIGMVVLLTATAALASGPPTMEWVSMKSPIPTPVYWAAHTAFEGKVYIIGGIPFKQIGDTADCNLLQIYDIATDTWSYGTPRVNKVRLASACVIGRKIYVTGGRDESAPYDYHEVYDIDAGTWSTAKKLPSVLRGHTAVAVGGKLYTIGGNRGTASAIYSNTVNIYDPTTDSWTTGKSSPVRWAYGGAAYCASTGKIYQVAGDNGSCTDCAGEFPKQSYGYHVATNTWDASPAAMPFPDGYPGIHEFGIASTDDKVYTFGGGYYSVDQASDQTPFPYCFVLNAATNTWDYSPYLPSPIARFNPMAATDGGKIYVVGGSQTGNPYSVDLGPTYVDIFNPAASADGAFVETYPPSIEERFAPTAQAVNGKVYFFGGATDAPLASVLVYDTTTKAWSTTNAADPHPRYMAASGVWNGKIVISGGQSGTSGSPDYNPIYVNSAVLYDPAADTFTALTAEPTGRTDATGAVVGDTFYVFGGTSATGTLLNTAAALNLVSDTWTTLPNLPSAFSNATAVAVGGKIYIVGGQDGGASPDNGLKDATIVFDPATRGYSTVADTPYATYAGVGSSYNGYVIVDSGMHRYFDADAGTVYSELSYYQQVYDPTTNTWTLMIRPWGKFYHGGAVSGDYLYSCLGQDWDYYTTRLDVAQLGSGGPTCTLTCTANATPTSGNAPLAVSFTATATATGCQGTPAYAWTFGDQGTSAQQNPSHTYTTAGTYNWTLTVTVDDKTCTKGGSITVTEVPPECVLVSCTANANPTSGLAPLAVTFTSSVSTTGPCDNPTFAWAFGDGSTAATKDTSHTYQTAGTYNWTYTATVNGHTCTKNGTITVTDVPVCAVTCTANAAPTSGTEPLTVSFTSTVTPTNCAGQPTYSWVFGDGVVVATQNAEHTYATHGTYNWTYGVTVDSVTCTKSGTITVNPAGNAPTVAIGDATGAVGATVQLPITLTNNGAVVCGTSNKISYDVDFLTFVEATLGPAGSDAGKQVFVNQDPVTHVITLGVSGFNTTPIADGIVAYVKFTINPAASGSTSVTSVCGASDCAGTDLTANCTNGTVTVQTHGLKVDLNWTAPVAGDTCNPATGLTATLVQPTESLGNPGISIGEATAREGESVTLPITLTNNGAVVCGTSNKITYDFAKLDYVEATLGPAGSAAGKQVFVNQNPTTKVITLGVSGFNTTPIADGIVAYIKFTIKAGATGDIAIQNQCGASDCSGTDLTGACVNGAVHVFTPPVLQGYDVYRGLTQGGDFTKINTTLIPVGTTTFRDNNPPLGMMYYRVLAVYNNCTPEPSNTASVNVALCGLECTANATPTSGDRPLTVLFTATTTQTPADCAGAETYSWNFGDGSTATTKNATHTYTAEGTHTWTFTVTAGNFTCTKTGTVTVTVPPCKITVCTATATATVPLLVNFSGNVVTEGECGNPTYAWTFGDGATATTKDAAHTYAAAGTYDWTFTVTVNGLTCSKSGTVQALCDAPTVTAVTKITNPFRLKIDTTNLQAGYKVYLAGQTTAWTNIKVKTASQFIIKGCGSLFPKDGNWVDIKIVNPSGCAITVQYNKSLKSWRIKP